MSRSCVSSLLISAAALVAAAAPAAALADTVRLKNGQVIEGKVEDRGAYVIVHKKLGQVRIERFEILSIEMEGQGVARRDADIVVLLSGDEIAGKVRLEDEGRKIVVVRELDGHENRAEFEHRQVRTILWAQGTATAADAGPGASVEKLIADLRAPDPEKRDQARERLIDLGVFLLPYLERRPADPDPAVQEVLARVVAIGRIKSYLSPALIERVPNLARRLVDPSPAARLEALKEAVVAAAADAAPLLVHIVRTDPAREIRAFILAQLALQNRTTELVELLQAQDGSLRLAAAIALGDNGVHVGLPIVFEALKLDDAAIRRVAIQKLESWTGQFLGYFPDDPPEKRAAAIERWEKWFATDGKKFVEDSLRATVHKHAVTDEEKSLGLADWVRAQKVWDDVEAASPPLDPARRREELEKVRFLLQKALERYPQYVNARLSLAILSYAELGDPEAAKRELEIVLSRYADDGGAPTRLTAHYHLARIAHAAKRWTEADRHYRQARAIDARDYDVQQGLALLCYDRALGDASLSTDDRRAALDEAVRFFTEAIAAVDARDLELRESADAADAIAAESPFGRGRFLKTLDRTKDALTRRAAELRFLRGRAYAALRRDAEAYTDYAAAARLVPEDKEYAGAAATWKPRAEAAAPPAGKKPPPTRFSPDDVPDERR